MPTVAPNVQFIDTFPFASDTPELDDTEPSVVAKLTVAPAKGLPFVSLTITIIGFVNTVST